MSELLSYARSTVHHYLQHRPAHALGGDGAELPEALTAALAALPRGTSFATPRLVVVGTQSSGKSSLLNALMGVPLLPTGDTMTTRAAVQVELVASSGAPRVECGRHEGGEWGRVSIP